MLCRKPEEDSVDRSESEEEEEEETKCWLEGRLGIVQDICGICIRVDAWCVLAPIYRTRVEQGWLDSPGVVGGSDALPRLGYGMFAK